MLEEEYSSRLRELGSSASSPTAKKVATAAGSISPNKRIKAEPKQEDGHETDGCEMDTTMQGEETSKKEGKQKAKVKIEGSSR